jgi:hypothetical protein
MKLFFLMWFVAAPRALVTPAPYLCWFPSGVACCSPVYAGLES